MSDANAERGVVQVKYFATIRELTGMKEELCPREATVLALVESLARRHGRAFGEFCLDGGAISRNVNILVNGKHIHHIADGDTPLEPGDEVSIFPLIGGG